MVTVACFCFDLPGFPGVSLSLSLDFLWATHQNKKTSEKQMNRSNQQHGLLGFWCFFPPWFLQPDFCCWLQVVPDVLSFVGSAASRERSWQSLRATPGRYMAMLCNVNVKTCHVVCRVELTNCWEKCISQDKNLVSCTVKVIYKVGGWFACRWGEDICGLNRDIIWWPVFGRGFSFMNLCHHQEPKRWHGSFRRIDRLENMLDCPLYQTCHTTAR